MRETITISLPTGVKKELDRIGRDEGLTRSEVVKRSLDDYLFFQRFRALRQKISTQAQSQGVFSDQDVFDRVS